MPALLTTMLLATAAALPVGTEVHYTGTVGQPTATGATTVKSFTLTAQFVPGEANGADLVYQVDERGGGGWAWPERFGRVALSAAEGSAIRLLQTFDGTDYPVAVRRPVFEYLDRLQPDASWSIGQHQYTCVRTTTQKGREC